MLEEQRIGPELRLQDFDKYMSLMNGLDAEKVNKFIKIQPPFAKFQELIHHYKTIEMDISKSVWSVISMGLYEFHRETLIETLEELARFMQSDLLKKMVTDQQAEMAQLQAEYEQISQTALRIPSDTAELMLSKAYVTKTDNKTIPDMEDRLRQVRHILKNCEKVFYFRTMRYTFSHFYFQKPYNFL